MLHKAAYSYIEIQTTHEITKRLQDKLGKVVAIDEKQKVWVFETRIERSKLELEARLK